MKRIIRPALPDDFATLVAIDQNCFEEDVAYDAYELRYFMSQSSATTLVAEVDGAIAGFLLFEIRGAQSGATLVTLDVTDIYRNAGIGSALLAHSEELLANHHTTCYRLQVDTTNSVAPSSTADAASTSFVRSGIITLTARTLILWKNGLVH